MYDSLTAVSLANVIADGSQASVVVANGRAMGAVSVSNITPGAVFFFRVGGAQWVRVTAACTFYGFDPLVEGSQGLFIRNDTAQAGATFDMIVGYVSDRDRMALEAARTQS